jgi:hypothetical protein
MLSILKLIIVVAIGSHFSQGQNIGTAENFQVGGFAKAENGLIISWQSVSEDVSASQVSLCDRQGHLLTSLKLLALVPDAKRADVFDVSARPGGIIAVSAIYVSKEGTSSVPPAATLLLFDFSGRLLSLFSLAPWRDVLRIEVDEQSNIWTLTSHAEEGKNPALYSMVVEYTTRGDIVNELLPRNLFPSHADKIHGSSETGFAHMGYDSTNGLWFWLPGSTDFVTVPPGGGAASRTKTGVLSGGANPNYPVNVVRVKSGTLVAEFRSEKFQRAYYEWSLSTKSWTRFKPGTCDGGWLIGQDDEDQVYVRQSAVAPPNVDICMFRASGRVLNAPADVPGRALRQARHKQVQH